MKPLKIALVASEGIPFSKTGGLADVVGALSSKLSSLGCEVKVFLPLHQQTKRHSFGIEIFERYLTIDLGNKTIAFSLHHCQKEKVDFYFIEKDEYFDREPLYGTPWGDYSDNALRFAFFSKAILDCIFRLEWKPDIIHANDWQTALVPFYLKYGFKDADFFKNTKVLFTIHNLAYRGLFGPGVLPEIGISYDFFKPESLEFYGNASLIKAGILYSDAISTVSEAYSREILAQGSGWGLDGLLRMRRKDLYGILNGVDYSCWDPGKDQFIKAQYDTGNLQNKLECKKDLLFIMGLPERLHFPLLGTISRLTEQKGIDIIIESANRLMQWGCNLVILGMGEERYEKALTGLAERYPGHIAVKIGFDNALSHKIEAGCDMFLMPSRYEPCGLSQMYSLKYGTIPIVRAVGGLDDTIVDYTQNPEVGNGFKFKEASPLAFIDALERGVFLFKDKEAWRNLTARAMKADFSWERSAREYIKLYEGIVAKG
jgi:starch synthase